MGCTLCPRRCGANRITASGACLAGSKMRLAAIVVHRGEEPPLVKGSGSGAVFFSGCPLKCPYCQNRQISHLGLGCDVSPEKLFSYMLELQELGCSNINLVTPLHYAEELLTALTMARGRGLSIPVVLNSSGYESVETLKRLLPHLDIFLMDMRYGDNQAGEIIGGIPDYWDRAMDAVEFLWQHAGALKTDPSGRAVSGMMIRHLILPGLLSNPFAVLDFLACISLKIPISLMAQYNPEFYSGENNSMKRRITPGEYQKVLERAVGLGFETIFSQAIDSPDSYKPDFKSLHPFDEGMNLLARDGSLLEEYK